MKVEQVNSVHDWEGEAEGKQVEMQDVGRERGARRGRQGAGAARTGGKWKRK